VNYQRHIRAIVLSLAVTAAGCASVAPWERGNLARPQMDGDAIAAQRALLEHIYESREAAAGKTSARGGGCGCY
jgi:Domain of unknown function (DUF4266)